MIDYRQADAVEAKGKTQALGFYGSVGAKPFIDRLEAVLPVSA